MKINKSVSASEDKAAVERGEGVALYADDTVIVMLIRDDEGFVRDQTAPAWVFESFLSEKYPAVVARSCNAEEAAASKFEYNGVTYIGRSANIEDVTPVDQSDLTYPGAIAAKTPEMYESFESLHAAFTNPESDEIQSMLDSIHRAAVEEGLVV
jgi:hypothetical protein